MSGATERANEQTDEQVAQYFNLGFWLFWPTVQECPGGSFNVDGEMPLWARQCVELTFKTAPDVGST